MPHYGSSSLPGGGTGAKSAVSYGVLFDYCVNLRDEPTVIRATVADICCTATRSPLVTITLLGVNRHCQAKLAVIRPGRLSQQVMSSCKLSYYKIIILIYFISYDSIVCLLYLLFCTFCGEIKHEKLNTENQFCLTIKLQLGNMIDISQGCIATCLRKDEIFN